MLDDLLHVLDELDARAREEPRLERYRVPPGGHEALSAMPQGWKVSVALEHLAVNGGWWPGQWRFPVDDEMVPVLLTGGPPAPGAAVRWLGVGSVWERDHFWTPALPEQATYAPLFGFSNQALWSSMVFPAEHALLEAFVVAFDEMGLDDLGEVNPFFVEWVTDAPPEHEGEAAVRVHQRLRTLSATWHSDHPCWSAEHMPALHADARSWPRGAITTLLGTHPPPG